MSRDMQHPPLDPLFGFIESLRDRGFRLGADQFLAVRDVLLALAAARQFPRTPEDLCRVLGPVLCTDAQQQSALPPAFTDWLDQDAEWGMFYQGPPQPFLGKTPTPPAQGLDQERSKTPWSRWSWLWVAAFVFALLVTWLHRDEDPVVNDPQFQIPDAIYGKVYSDESRSARVAGAVLKFSGLETTTDDQGQYRLDLFGRTGDADVLTISHEDFEKETTYYLNLRGLEPEQNFVLRSDMEKNADLARLQAQVDKINAAVDALEKPMPTRWQSFIGQYVWPLRLGLWGLLTLLWLALMTWHWRRTQSLRRQRVGTRPEQQPIRVARTRKAFFHSPAWRKLVRQMRQPAMAEHKRLHMGATLQLSLHKGGLFTPVLLPEKETVSHLMLIERQSFDDHFCHLAERWIARLVAIGGDVDVYYFRGSPQQLIKAGDQQQRATLAQISARHPHHALWVFSDTISCFSAFDGLPQIWLKQVQRWQRCTFLVPSLQDRAMAHNVARLRGMGFQVQAFAQENFEALLAGADERGHHRLQVAPVAIVNLNFRDLAEKRDEGATWKEVSTHLLQSLRGCFDPASWYWVQACAVFPVIYWELTLFLGLNLVHDDKQVYSEDRLMQLAGLSWFRTGQLADGLRLALVQGLSPKQKSNIQHLVETWMATTSQGVDAFPLHFAPPETRRRFQQSLRDMGNDTPSTQDAVMASVLSAGKDKAVGFRLPKFLRGLLFKKANPLAGMRLGWPLVVFALLLIILVKPINLPKLETYIPRFAIKKGTVIDSGKMEINRVQGLFQADSEKPAMEYERLWQAGASPGKNEAHQSVFEAIKAYLRGASLIASDFSIGLDPAMPLDIAPVTLFRSERKGAPILQVSRNPVLVGETVEFFILSNLPIRGTRYKWNFGSGKGKITSEQNATHIFEKAGIYQIIVEVEFPFFNSNSYLVIDPIELTLLVTESLPVGTVRIFREGGLEIPMVWCPPGTFMMGSPESEKERNDYETQHQVTLTQGFWLAQTEVTQAQWQAVMGNNPSEFKGEDLPVENVSWQDVQAFITKLNGKMGNQTYRLPTEAEWEYACRAGTTTPFQTGENLTTDQANYNGNYPYANYAKGIYREKATPVKTFPANAWGLYDMHGNVREWCQDWIGEYAAGPQKDPSGPGSGQVRVLRGGSWYGYGRDCRSADRGGFPPGSRYGSIGFRLARGQEAL